MIFVDESTHSQWRCSLACLLNTCLGSPCLYSTPHTSILTLLCGTQCSQEASTQEVLMSQAPIFRWSAHQSSASTQLRQIELSKECGIAVTCHHHHRMTSRAALSSWLAPCHLSSLYSILSPLNSFQCHAFVSIRAGLVRTW